MNHLVLNGDLEHLSRAFVATERMPAISARSHPHETVQRTEKKPKRQGRFVRSVVAPYLSPIIWHIPVPQAGMPHGVEGAGAPAPPLIRGADSALAT